MKTDKTYISLILLAVFTAIAWITSCTHTADISEFPEICFDSDVLHIYSSNCAISGCHNGNGEEAMALNSYNDIFKTVVPYNPDASRSYQSIIAKWGNRMPPDRPLSKESRTIIRLWIEQGASHTQCNVDTGGNNNHVIQRACFSRDILPVIVSKCGSTGCHDAVTHAEGRIFSTYTNIRSTVVAGNPGASSLYQIITSTGGEDKMPPSTKPQLTVAEIDSLRQWIIYGALNENCGEVCDTVNQVTFSGVIWPLIQSTCTGCHSGTAPSGNVLLASYSNVATVAASGVLLNSLKGAGVPKMPLSGSLSACRIRQFEIWINNGYLNN